MQQSNVKKFAPLLATISLLMAGILPSSANNHGDYNTYEPAILKIIETIKNGELNNALVLTETHLQEFPKSRVGHLLKADILQALVFNPTSFTSSSYQRTKEIPISSETTLGLRHQIRNRWLHHNRDQLTHSKLPASLVDMGRHKHVMVSDMSAGRLYLYRNRNGEPELVKDYYLTVGSAGYGKEYEGDNKTPIGVYSIYQHIPGAELPDLYGKGAYPVDYPNRYDRALKRTGYGIWLHGTPSNTYARSPWASEGCFVLSNDDLLDIEKYIDVEGRTPVILADEIEWVSPAELDQRRERLNRTIQAWQKDWESLNTQAYLDHYSRENFNFGTENFNPWARRKEQVNAAKTFIQVDLAVESLFLYPGETDMFVVQYQQKYLSNNYAGATTKEQYWRRESDGRWRIVYES